MAREYAWLSERQDTFSPASCSLMHRLLPIVYLTKTSQDFVLASLDISNAFLQVPQVVPTNVTYKRPDGSTEQYALGKVLPGQRDGSLRWYLEITQFFADTLGLRPRAAYPTLLRNEAGTCYIQLHVDDMMAAVLRGYFHSQLIPALQTRFDVTIELLEEEGQSISFLKRRHELLPDGSLLITPDHRHFEKLWALLDISALSVPKKTPPSPAVLPSPRCNSRVPEMRQLPDFAPNSETSLTVPLPDHRGCSLRLS